MTVIYTPRGRALEYSPKALNLGLGCVHACAYCYAPGALRKARGPFHTGFEPKKNILARIEKDAAKMSGSTDRVLISFTHDPYQGLPTDNLTRDAILVLKRHGLNFQILTKGGRRACGDFDLYGPNDAFATSLTFAGETDSLEIEPGAAPPSERIAAIKEARRRGIQTWVSFEPVLNAADVFELYENTKDTVELYKIGKCSGYRSNVTDWKAFGHEMIRRLERDQIPYYIKHDLAALL